MSQATDVYYDPYDVEISADPYPVFRRLRDEAPLYYNETHEFYAVSRADDVERGLSDREHFSNARSDVLEAGSSEGPVPHVGLGWEEDAVGDGSAAPAARVGRIDAASAVAAAKTLTLPRNAFGWGSTRTSRSSCPSSTE